MDRDTYYLVDKNGEVIEEIEANERGRFIYAEEGDRLLKRNSLAAYDRRKRCGEAKMDFAKVNRKHLDEISSECPIVITLIKYINYVDNVLMYANGKILNPTNLSRVTKKSLSTCKRQFKKLTELGIIKRIKVDGKYVYAFDPYVANCSKNISQETLDLFFGSKYREEE